MISVPRLFSFSRDLRNHNVGKCLEKLDVSLVATKVSPDRDPGIHVVGQLDRTILIAAVHQRVDQDSSVCMGA